MFLAERQNDEREILLCFLLATPLSPFKDLQWPLKDYKWDSTMGASAKKDIQSSSSSDKLALKSFYTPQFYMPFQSLRPNQPVHVRSWRCPNPPQRHPAVASYNSLQIAKKEKKRKDISDGPVIAWDCREVWRGRYRLWPTTPTVGRRKCCHGLGPCFRFMQSTRANFYTVTCHLGFIKSCC